MARNTQDNAETEAGHPGEVPPSHSRASMAARFRRQAGNRSARLNLIRYTAACPSGRTEASGWQVRVVLSRRIGEEALVPM